MYNVMYERPGKLKMPLIVIRFIDIVVTDVCLK